MTRLRLRQFPARLREPVNSLTHWAGALLAFPVLAGLLVWAHEHHLPLWPFVVFGVSMAALYASSATYHSLRVNERAMLWLRKLDHSAIFLLIAGSYTPLAYLGLSGVWQSVVLWVIWGIAISGILLKMLTMRLPRWISTLLYVAMGWMALAFVPQLARTLPTAAMIWLGVGGALYTLGAVVYATKRWSPFAGGRSFPRNWGFHEVWHLFVLGGTGAHVAMMFTLR
ncbi:PAQR family membrane homeostasis protein TrhA [Deinococcus ruber]|uniref:Hemolysin n=1 Tax=Deinococcus ruber TaxID=1848197 RepID=A0A918F249_9DEIO|nr:hemolysin III family protein [Deinococcus ruber]GGQ93998.1 hemolysin [Deinococcus ruber]